MSKIELYKLVANRVNSGESKSDIYYDLYESGTPHKELVSALHHTPSKHIKNQLCFHQTVYLIAISLIVLGKLLNIALIATLTEAQYLPSLMGVTIYLIMLFSSVFHQELGYQLGKIWGAVGFFQGILLFGNTMSAGPIQQLLFAVEIICFFTILTLSFYLQQRLFPYRKTNGEPKLGNDANYIFDYISP